MMSRNEFDIYVCLYIYIYIYIQGESKKMVNSVCVNILKFTALILANDISLERSRKTLSHIQALLETS